MESYAQGLRVASRHGKIVSENDISDEWILITTWSILMIVTFDPGLCVLFMHACLAYQRDGLEGPP
jgi:hypothetical protein